jgi:hypothetical protein
MSQVNERNRQQMSASINPAADQATKLSPDVIASASEDGVTILDAHRGRLFRSNQAGAYIWRCIEQQLPCEAIAEKLCAHYRIQRPAADEHTARFLDQLAKHGLTVGRAA